MGELERKDLQIGKLETWNVGIVCSSKLSVFDCSEILLKLLYAARDRNFAVPAGRHTAFLIF